MGLSVLTNVVRGRVPRTTPVYDSYWRFATSRQDILFRRVEGGDPPWTEDPIIRGFRFTNAYRAADRTTQYLIRHVIYNANWSAEDLTFRVLVFKTFNRIHTWEYLQRTFGSVTQETFDIREWGRSLSQLHDSGKPVYSGAYVMPAVTGLGNHAHKHDSHLALIALMMRDNFPQRLQECRSLRDVYALLRSYPSIGRFLAYQYAIDINYSRVVDFSEMSFVIAGPGAVDGIAKCFADRAGFADADLIRWVADNQDSEFRRRGLNFRRLGTRPLQLIDCQNLFCEIDKYARIAHPQFTGVSGRTRMKRRYAPSDERIDLWFPPKWGINGGYRGATL